MDLDCSCVAWNLKHRDNNFPSRVGLTAQAGNLSGVWACYPALEEHRSCVSKDASISFDFALSKVLQLREGRGCTASREKGPETSDTYETIHILQSAKECSSIGIDDGCRCSGTNTGVCSKLTARPVNCSSSSCPGCNILIVQSYALKADLVSTASLAFSCAQKPYDARNEFCSFAIPFAI